MPRSKTISEGHFRANTISGTIHIMIGSVSTHDWNMRRFASTTLS